MHVRVFYPGLRLVSELHSMAIKPVLPIVFYHFPESCDPTVVDKLGE